MYKFIITLMLFSVSLLARQEAFPNQECPAFNNMKHTRNTHDVLLKQGKETRSCCQGGHVDKAGF